MLWGVIDKRKLIVYKAREKTVAKQGTKFTIYTDLYDAIEARDQGTRGEQLVVVSLDEENIQFIRKEELNE